jgi:hypothetical protein
MIGYSGLNTSSKKGIDTRMKTTIISIARGMKLYFGVRSIYDLVIS